MLYKRLEQGRFTNMWIAGTPSRLSSMALRLLPEGAKREGKLPLTPPKLRLLCDDRGGSECLPAVAFNSRTHLPIAEKP